MYFKIVAVVVFFGCASADLSGAQTVESQPGSPSPTASPSVAKLPVREKVSSEPSGAPARDGATETRAESASAVAPESPSASLPPPKSHHTRVRAAAAEAPIAASAKPGCETISVGHTVWKEDSPRRRSHRREHATIATPQKICCARCRDLVRTHRTDRSNIRQRNRPAGYGSCAPGGGTCQYSGTGAGQPTGSIGRSRHAERHADSGCAS